MEIFSPNGGNCSSFWQIEPNIMSEWFQPNRDKIVVSDRGFLSGIGYALAHGEFEFEYLVELNRFALSNSFPDSIIFFKIDRKTLHQRVGDKSLDSIEARGLNYLLLVQDKMLWSLKRLKIPHLIVDATQSIERVQKSILDYFSTLQIY